MAQTHNINSKDRRHKVKLNRRKQKDRCAYCGVKMLFDPKFKLENDYCTLEHIIPSVHPIWQTHPGRGPNQNANVILACRYCNCNVVRHWSIEKKLKKLKRTIESCLR